MSKDSRSGGKYTRSHSTLIPFAAAVCDIVNIIPQVKKISLGFIEAGNGNGHGHKLVKPIKESNVCILLKVRDNASHQEIRVFFDSSDISIVILAIEQKLRDADIAICSTKD